MSAMTDDWQLAEPYRMALYVEFGRIIPGLQYSEVKAMWRWVDGNSKTVLTYRVRSYNLGITKAGLLPDEVQKFHRGEVSPRVVQRIMHRAGEQRLRALKRGGRDPGAKAVLSVCEIP